MEREITITVTDEEARRIDERVAAGEFKSATEFVHAALSTALWEQLGWDDDALRAAIAKAESDTRPPIPARQAFENVRAYIRSLADDKVGR